MKFSLLFCCIILLIIVISNACQKELPVDPKPVTIDSLDTIPTTDTIPVTDTAAIQITVINPGFEDSLTAWQVETTYKGRYGFSSSKKAKRSGGYGLNFYAAQVGHFPNAPQETPWNGKIYQTITGLQNGNYTFKIYADAVGEGMYLWADGGGGEVKTLIKSDSSEVNTISFVVTNGVAKFGFICIDANGSQYLAPYFHADDAELWFYP